MLAKFGEMKSLGGDNCFKVRITSGSEKGETAFINRNFIGSLIPTRVRVGEAGILWHELRQQVRIYDKIETYNEHLSDWIAFQPKPLAGMQETLIGGMLFRRSGYDLRGKWQADRSAHRSRCKGFEFRQARRSSRLLLKHLPTSRFLPHQRIARKLKARRAMSWHLMSTKTPTTRPSVKRTDSLGDQVPDPILQIQWRIRNATLCNHVRFRQHSNGG